MSSQGVRSHLPPPLHTHRCFFLFLVPQNMFAMKFRRRCFGWNALRRLYLYTATWLNLNEISRLLLLIKRYLRLTGILFCYHAFTRHQEFCSGKRDVLSAGTARLRDYETPRSRSLILDNGCSRYWQSRAASLASDNGENNTTFDRL